ncbi:hypothetical protein AVEN_16674-1 [Araneus ventricosus]|uniref:Uncharacterized protein n=1 Tax=Araneus ventricosus TaxID=182803 RepID=A0A4Y2V2I5_ARAVE|nr:hypothetical protein AVEN_16674-1 [Araneus ventricosus]
MKETRKLTNWLKMEQSMDIPTSLSNFPNILSKQPCELNSCNSGRICGIKVILTTMALRLYQEGACDLPTELGKIRVSSPNMGLFQPISIRSDSSTITSAAAEK